QPEVIPLIALMEFPQPEGRARRAPRPRPAAPPSQTEPLQEAVQDRVGGCYIKDTRGGGKMDDKTRTELEAATFRALVAHLRERTDVQNIDLMNLAGFCRNCLSKWYRAAAEEKGVELSDPQAREIVYGMPYDEWRKQHQKEATPEQKAAFAASQPKHWRRLALVRGLRYRGFRRIPLTQGRGTGCRMSGGLP